MLQKNRIFTASAATLVAASLVGTSLVSAQDVQETQELTSVSGHALWNVRDSFMSYMQMPFMAGTVTASDGATWSAGSPFNLPVDSDSTVITANDQAVIDLDGAMHFSGHHGALDIDFSDFKVNINGSVGTLTVDYSSLSMEGATYTGNDEVLVNITFSEPVDLSTGGEIVGQTTLADTGVEIFADFYNAGDPMAPITLNLDPIFAPEPTPEPPVTTEPETSEPETSEPETSEPETSAPESNQPSTSATSAPVTSEPAPADSDSSSNSNGGLISILSSIFGFGAIAAVLVALGHFFLNFGR